MNPSVKLIDRFQGCMIGALLGDCLGATFEMQYDGPVPQHKMETFFQSIRKRSIHCTKVYRYTDDTAMARQIAESFVGQGGFDFIDIARRFAKGYSGEPWRGYGGSVVEVFSKLAENPTLPFLPASQQFDGAGSYGNGAGMRAHPIALGTYSINNYDEVIKLAENVARITHAHQHGITGGVLQALACNLALKRTPPKEMLEKLQELIGEYEKKNIDSRTKSRYTDKLAHVKELLENPEWDLADAIFKLGNDVSAINSVPTALYCFMRAMELPDDKDMTKYESAIQLAISFGGDTDTIASMAGAICGAHVGIQGIPAHLQYACEGFEHILALANQMYALMVAAPDDSRTIIASRSVPEGAGNGVKEEVKGGNEEFKEELDKGSSSPPEKKPKV